MVREHIYRIQDSEGRGPFKPGFTHLWIDKERQPFPPPFTEHPKFASVVKRAHSKGLHLGAAVIGWPSLARWFSTDELFRLYERGYWIVDARGCTVELYDDFQVLVSSPLPLRFCPASPPMAKPTWDAVTRREIGDARYQHVRR
jgi:hypothetical protein